jgi:hypothetical protein
MRVETTKKLILTKEERRIICDLYQIFDDDESLSATGVWDILSDIYENGDDRSIDYGYYIEIVDD